MPAMQFRQTDYHCCFCGSWLASDAIQANRLPLLLLWELACQRCNSGKPITTAAFVGAGLPAMQFRQTDYHCCFCGSWLASDAIQANRLPLLLLWELACQRCNSGKPITTAAFVGAGLPAMQFRQTDYHCCFCGSWLASDAIQANRLPLLLLWELACQRCNSGKPITTAAFVGAGLPAMQSPRAY